MRFVDCYWEKKVLGCRVEEIMVESSDFPSIGDFGQIDEYDYVVVKVPMCKFETNRILSDLGFSLAEVQCKLSKSFKSFDFEDKLINFLYPDVSFSDVTEERDFQLLLDRITPGMFSTDRITLDPVFGKEKGCMRYKNWMSDAFEKHDARFMSILYKNTPVGFSMFTLQDGIVDGILGGIFEKYQSQGLGILTPARHFLCAQKNGISLKKIRTSISSNNIPVWQLYNYLNFKIEQLYYVFVKHVKH